MDNSGVRLGKEVVIDDEGELQVVGVGQIFSEKHSPLVASEKVLFAADLDSLTTALRDPERYRGGISDVIDVARDEDFDPFLFEADKVHLELFDDGLRAVAEVFVPSGRRLSQRGYHQLLARPLEAMSCRVTALQFVMWDGSLETEADWIEWDDPEERAATLEEPRVMRVQVGARSVEHLIRGARQARALLEAAVDGPIDAGTTARLISSGMPETVVGLQESDWLEVKSQPYQLNAPKPISARAKLELAQDVARLANGDVSAVLLIGYTTRRTSAGVEIVDAVVPAKVAAVDVEQHRKVVDAHIYPSVDGLDVKQVLVGDRAVLVVEVPRQPEYLKPFLVHGAIVGDRADGSFISIVRRRGAHSLVTDPSQIHAQIAAGRAFLQANPQRDGEPG